MTIKLIGQSGHKTTTGTSSASNLLMTQTIGVSSLLAAAARGQAVALFPQVELGCSFSTPNCLSGPPA